MVYKSWILSCLGQKSRAEAMLERVRLQPQSVKIDPLDNARLWNIHIYSVQEVSSTHNYYMAVVD